MRLTPAIPYAIVALIAIALFAPSLPWGLLNWDDPLHLTGNPYLATPAHFWREPYAKLYIPLAYTLWSLLYPLCTDAAGGFLTAVPLRVVNLVLHATNACLVVAVCRQLGAGRLGATAGGLLFAVFPLQVESVAWLSELRGLLAAVFSLACVLLHLRGRRVISPMLLSLALLCKPSAAAVPLILLAIDRLSLGVPWRRSLAHLTPHLSLAAIASLAMPLLLQPAGADATLRTALHLRPLVAADALAFYLAKLALPWPLSADYSRTPALAAAGQWFYLSWVVPLVCGLLAVAWRPLRLPLAVFVAALAPVLGLVPFEFQRISTVADRYAYLALLGPALLVALLPVWHRRSTRAIGAALLAAWVAVASVQLNTWRSDDALWSHAARVNPGAVVALCNLAERAATAGRPDEAHALFTRAHRADPRRGSPLVGLAKLARDRGDVTEAEEFYRRAIAVDPADPIPFTDLGSLLIEQRRPGDAEQTLSAGLALHPDYADLHHNLAGLRYSQGRRDDALASARTVLRLNPRHVRSLLLLAMLTDDEAPAREAHRLDPSDPAPARWLLGRALAASRWTDAEALARHLLAIDPTDVAALNNLGRSLAAQGKLDDAIRTFEEALRLRPDSQTLRENLEAARTLARSRVPAR